MRHATPARAPMSTPRPPTSTRGRIAAVYIIFCGGGERCPSEPMELSGASSPGIIGPFLETRGYRYTRRKGWLCPHCASAAERARLRKRLAIVA
jgi:hypothetical protein